MDDLRPGCFLLSFREFLDKNQEAYFQSSNNGVGLRWNLAFMRFQIAQNIFS